MHSFNFNNKLILWLIRLIQSLFFIFLSCLLCSTHATASAITVDISGNFKNGITDISINNGNNKDVQININESGGTDGNISSGTTDAKGKYSSGDLSGLTIGASSVDIVVAGEHYKGITADGTYTSEEQKPPPAKGKVTQGPFNGSYSTFTAYNGTHFDQFDLVNNDRSNAYMFTDLKIYNIPISFFTQVDFNSPEAIMNGTLVIDLLAENGGWQTIPIAGLAATPSLSFVIDAGDIDTYNLLTGTAMAMLPGGGTGSPIDFGVANAVPEPSTWILFSSGLAGLFGYACRRNKRTKNR